VRQLLGGEMVTTHTAQVNLDQVQMRLKAETTPPLYIGAMREKTLQLAGRIGDGTILDACSSPAYVRWAWDHIHAGMAESGRTEHRVAVYCYVKVHPNREIARAAVREALAMRWPWAECQVNPLNFAEEVTSLAKRYDRHKIAAHIPDEWVDTFSAAGAAKETAATIQRLFAAGANTVVFQPLEGDPDCLDEYTRYLLPLLREQHKSSRENF
jgi:5,10-methylenetetrahydromethanopterin reductase